MNKKFFILVALILSIIRVCPLPFENIISSYLSYVQTMQTAIQSLSGLNILFHTSILIGMIFYFKKHSYNSSYSYNSETILTCFIIVYVLLLILNSKIANLIQSFDIITKIVFIVTFILIVILTILFIILIKDCSGLKRKNSIIVSTLSVTITQIIILLRTFLYYINRSKPNNTYDETAIMNSIENFREFTYIMGIISFITVTIMKIIFILLIVKIVYEIDENKEEIFQENQ